MSDCMTVVCPPTVLWHVFLGWPEVAARWYMTRLTKQIEAPRKIGIVEENLLCKRRIFSQSLRHFRSSYYSDVMATHPYACRRQ